MAPKKQVNAQAKAKDAAKVKNVEDKTFGMKNKNKSKTVQKQINTMKAAATGQRVKTDDEIRAEQKARTAALSAKKETKAIQASLEKARMAMKLIEQKKKEEAEKRMAELKKEQENKKIDYYTDPRIARGVLPENVSQKPCDNFLDAIEQRKYGWFWKCPNGDGCVFAHAIPAGYVLKGIHDKVDDNDEELTLEEQIELERAALPAGGTPVTFESFMAWKAKKEAEKIEQEEADKKEREKKSGRKEMSGRRLFEFRPELFETKEEGEADDFETEMAALRKQAQEADEALEQMAIEEAHRNLENAKLNGGLYAEEEGAPEEDF